MDVASLITKLQRNDTLEKTSRELQADQVVYHANTCIYSDELEMSSFRMSIEDAVDAFLDEAGLELDHLPRVARWLI